MGWNTLEGLAYYGWLAGISSCLSVSLVAFSSHCSWFALKGFVLFGLVIHYEKWIFLIEGLDNLMLLLTVTCRNIPTLKWFHLDFFASLSLKGLNFLACIYIGNLMSVWTLPLLQSSCRGTRTPWYMHSCKYTGLVQDSWKSRLKRIFPAVNHGKDTAGLVVNRGTGDTGHRFLLWSHGHCRSSSCLVLPSPSQPPALWFSRPIRDLSKSVFCLCLCCNCWSRCVVWPLLST